MVSQDMAPEHRKIDGNAEYEAALDSLFARPGRLLRIFDRRLDIGYNTVSRNKLLRQFLLANSNNRIQIVLHDASGLHRDCPRLVNLLRQFSHAISINETEPEAKSVYDPFCVMDERDYVHRFHHDSARGVLALDDVATARVLAQRFEQIWEVSSPAPSATTLGL
jgi:hypothetical protein